jgi:hypothetical protein
MTALEKSFKRSRRCGVRIAASAAVKEGVDIGFKLMGLHGRIEA